MLPSLRLIILIMSAAPLFLAGTLYDFFTGVGVLYVLFLVIYTTFDALILPKRKKILIKRIAPSRISIGFPTLIEFEIQNKCKRSIEILLAEDPPPTIDITPDICRAKIEPGEKKKVEYRLTAHKRGKYELTNVYVRVLPIMGLLYRQFKLNLPETIKVFPNLINLRKYDLLIRRGLEYDQGLIRLKRIGQGSEFESLRHYVSGDELSHIEWKATAKRAKLITKNYEPEKQQNIIVAIDTGRATTGEFEGLSRVDYMVNATLMLAYAALRQNDWFSMIAFSDKIESYLPPLNGIKNIDRVARALYEVQPNLVESNYAMACRFLGLKNRKRSLLCMMTDVVDRNASNEIIAYMSRFARYHLPLTVTLTNTEIKKTAEVPIAKCNDPYSKAAALDAITAREEALILMRQRGISVLDVAPNHLTPELISRYTLIKAKHQL